MSCNATHNRKGNKIKTKQEQESLKPLAHVTISLSLVAAAPINCCSLDISSNSADKSDTLGVLPFMMK